MCAFINFFFYSLAVTLLIDGQFRIKLNMNFKKEQAGFAESYWNFPIDKTRRRMVDLGLFLWLLCCICDLAPESRAQSLICDLFLAYP